MNSLRDGQWGGSLASIKIPDGRTLRRSLKGVLIFAIPVFRRL